MARTIWNEIILHFFGKDFFCRDKSPLSSNGNMRAQCSCRTALRGHSSNKAYTEGRSKGLWTFKLSSRLGRNLYGVLDIGPRTLIMMLTLVPINPIHLSPRSCFLAERVTNNSCLWQGRNKNYGFVWAPYEYMSGRDSHSLPALLCFR